MDDTPIEYEQGTLADRKVKKMADTKFAKSPETVRQKGRRGRPRNAIKHAAYSSTDLMPLTLKRRREIARIIKGEITLITGTDAIMVELLARNLAKIELMDRWLDERGIFTGDGEVQPILKIYWQAVNSANRQCDALGLTPSSRLRMGLSIDNHPDLASQIGAGGNGGNGNHGGEDAEG